MRNAESGLYKPKLNHNMRTTLILALAFAAGSALAQGPNSNQGPRQGRNAPNMSPTQAGTMMLAEEIIMEKYDANKDGKLDETELAKLREDVQAKHEAKRAEVLAKFDTDKDGKLSNEERKAMREAWMKENPEAAKRMEKMRERRQNGQGPNKENRPNRNREQQPKGDGPQAGPQDGPQDKPEAAGPQGRQHRQPGGPNRGQGMNRPNSPMMTGGMMFLIEKYDTDKDGVLNETEQKALEADAVKKFEEKKAIREALKQPNKQPDSDAPQAESATPTE